MVDASKLLPEPLSPVISTLASLGGEDMDNQVAVVHQNPFPRGIPFHVAREDFLFFQRLLDRLGNGLGLALLQAVADEEQICKGTGALYVEGDRVGGLLLKGRLLNEIELTVEPDERALPAARARCPPRPRFTLAEVEAPARWLR